MPTFEIQNPQTGQTIEIDGPNMPSEQEMDEIFHATSAQQGPMGMSAALPMPPQEKSISGFMGNVIRDTGSEVANTITGLASIPGAVIGAAKNAYNDPAGIPGRLAQGVSNAATGLKDYAMEYAQHPLDTLYEHPVRALTDLSTLAMVGEPIAAARGMGKTAKALGTLSTANVPAMTMKGAMLPLKAAGKVAEEVGDIKGRFGAKGRNKAFLGKTVNPQGYAKETLDRTGEALKTDILENKATTFRGLEADYNKILGPAGEGMDTPLARAQYLPEPPKLAVDSNTVKTLADGRAVDYESPTFRSAFGDVEAPTFRQMHGEAQGLRGTERAAVQDKMRTAASNAGLTKEADEYFATAEKWSKAHEQFENRFVKSLLNKPDEAISGLFERGNQPTYQPRGTKSIYAGKAAKTYSNKELVGQLRGIVKPETMERLRAKVGDDIIRKMTSADQNYNPASLHSSLEKLDKAGILEDLIPNHKVLRDVAKIIESNQASSFWTMPGSKGFVRDTVHAALKKLRADDPDLQRALRKLQGNKHPIAKKLANALTKSAVAGAAYEHLPEPPAR